MSSQIGLAYNMRVWHIWSIVKGFHTSLESLRVNSLMTISLFVSIQRELNTYFGNFNFPK